MKTTSEANWLEMMKQIDDPDFSVLSAGETNEEGEAVPNTYLQDET